MKKIFFFSVVFVVFFALNTYKIFACSCAILTSDNLQELVERAYKDSEAVFSGEVTEINQEHRGGYVKVKFKVEKSWKNISQKEVLLTTGAYGGDCGYKFEVGKKYLVYTHSKKYPLYANGKMDSIETSICTRTSSSESNKDIAYLNKIKKLKINSSLK